MEDQTGYFTNFEELFDFIQGKKVGNILIGYQNIAEYPGMVLGKSIIFDIEKQKYELDLEWISFGLDLYGENLL